MAEDTDTLTKITIISGTAFDGALVEEKQVLDVNDRNRAQARYLISINKAVEGDATEEAVVDAKKSTNKSVGLNTQNGEALLKK